MKKKYTVYAVITKHGVDYQVNNRRSGAKCVGYIEANTTGQAIGYLQSMLAKTINTITVA
jgi:hypothetical protein